MTQIARQDRNLVARQAGDQIPWSKRLLNLARDVAQHGIPHGMAIAVVDLLETIQVELQHSKALSAGHCLLADGFKLHDKGVAVGQAGERIVAGQKLDLLLARFALGQVGEHADEVGDHAARIPHCADGGLLGKDFATLALVPQFARPVAGAPQLRPHGTVELAVVAARLEHARVAAQHLGFGVPQDAQRRRVGRIDGAQRIGDHHALGRVVHHRHGEALAFLGKSCATHVGQQPNDPLRLAIRPGEHMPARLKPAQLTVKALHGESLDQYLTCVERAVCCRPYPVAVRWHDAVHQIRFARQIFALVSQHACDTRRKAEGLRAHIPIPYAAGIGVECQPQPGVAAF